MNERRRDDGEHDGDGNGNGDSDGDGDLIFRESRGKA